MPNLNLQKDLQELYSEFQSLIEDDSDFNYSEDEFLEWLKEIVFCDQEIYEIKFINLSDCSKEHISQQIKEGYIAGEICESFGDNEMYGWWELQDRKVFCIINL